MSKHENHPIHSENPETQVVIERAIKSIWSLANQLSRITPKVPDSYSVTIFGSARIKPAHQLYIDAKDLARQLTEMGCDIVTGGGPGLMQAANEGARLGDPEGEQRSVGIRIALPFEKNANPFVEEAYTHETFFTRLHHFVRESSAFICVGGGIGTTLEALMVWQLLQVKHVDGQIPLIMVGPMWRGLVAWAKESMLSNEPPFASADDLELPVCVDTIDEAVALLRPRVEAYRAQQQLSPKTP